MRTNKFCPHCGRPLLKSNIKGYSYQCNACDEDFYRFEVLSTRYTTLARSIRKSNYDYRLTGGDTNYVVYKKPSPYLV